MEGEIIRGMGNSIRGYSDAIAVEMCRYLQGMKSGQLEIRNTAPHYKIMERLGLIVPEGVEQRSFRLTERELELRARLQI